LLEVEQVVEAKLLLRSAAFCSGVAAV